MATPSGLPDGPQLTPASIGQQGALNHGVATPVVKEHAAGAITDDPEPITRVLVAEIGHKDWRSGGQQASEAKGEQYGEDLTPNT